MTTTNTVPQTMKALFQPDHMSTEVILTQRPVPTPKPDSTEHLIKVHTVAPCARELLWFREFPLPEAKALVPCYDVAGTVVTAPAGSPFKPGDEVYARSHYARAGSGSEYAILTTEEMALRPKRLSWAESASVPLSALTAWQALFDQAGWASMGSSARGKRLLVTAAAGGCGTWLVQLARMTGAYVVGTCGPDNVEFVKSLGADEVINYRTTDVAEWGRTADNKVDLVIDCVGGKPLTDSWWCVKNGGTIISIVRPPEQFKPADCDAADVRNFFFVMSPNGSQLQKITALIEEGKCRPILDSTFALKDFALSFARVETGHARGKAVIDFDQQ